MNQQPKSMGWNLQHSYTELPQTMYTLQSPVPVAAPQLVIVNELLAGELGLQIDQLNSSEAVAIFSGNAVVDNSSPLAQAYAGHQFGNFTMLGDGRAILLGEQVTPGGKIFDVQLKGAGRTPYSRGGDGRAALGPMLREYIISEALHALHIPTSRSLAVVTTGETIIRENRLPGAILTRVAESHIRVGTFQYAANYRGIEELRALADYAIARHYPHLEQSENRYQAFLQAVSERQASLIAKWQLVGFIHGVMNTDNMVISGQSIDFGPCAFMNEYDPATVFSSIDTRGRYAYGNQPYIAGWNLARLAESLLPLLHDDPSEAMQAAQELVNKFAEMYYANWHEGMKKKLGLFSDEPDDKELMEALLQVMQDQELDFTNTFRALTLGQTEKCELWNNTDFMKWHEKWQARLSRQDQTLDQVSELMQQHNPAIIPRNHRVEDVLSAAVNQGDLQPLHQFLHVLREPFAYTEEQLSYVDPPKDEPYPYQTFCGT